MFKLIDYSTDLNLDTFYQNARSRGYDNNGSESILVNSFRNEHDFKLWILYYNGIAVGSTATHSLGILPNSYRICVRTCVFTDLLPTHHTLRTINNIRQHQHVTAQFFIPACVLYCPIESDLYITTHSSEIASQRLVHEIFCPTLAEQGCLEKTHELDYRGHVQTFWKLDKFKFMQQLDQFPKWNFS
jgi:hypothetical protein